MDRRSFLKSLLCLPFVGVAGLFEAKPEWRHRFKYHGAWNEPVRIRASGRLGGKVASFRIGPLVPLGGHPQERTK